MANVIKTYSSNLNTGLSTQIANDFTKNPSWTPKALSTHFDNIKKLHVGYVIYDTGTAEA